MTNIKWISYVEGYKYQLSETYRHNVDILGYVIETEFISLDPNGNLVLKDGYASDGPSGPTYDTKSSVRGAFIHDALYWLMRNGYIDITYKDYADKLFYAVLVEDGMWKLRAWIWYQGVHNRGINSLYPSSEKPILRAP